MVNTMHTAPPDIQPSREVLAMLVLLSTIFLLRASLALSSIGVKPSSFAHKCAAVVLPIPGGPEMKTAREVFIPFFPGFLKFDLRLFSLEVCNF